MNELVSTEASAGAGAGTKSFEGWAAFLQSAVKPYFLIPIAIFVIVSGMLFGFKEIKIDQMRGDSAIFFQVTENIANRGAAVSQVFANTQAYLESGLLVMPADKIAKDPLAPPPQAERNMLRFHAYFVLYPIAVLAKIIPVKALLLSLYVLAFTGVVLLAYFILRRDRMPLAAAALFCVLMMTHPGWSNGLLWGQFYPDRLFILFGFAFMYLATRKDSSLGMQIAAGAICLLIGERAAATAGIFWIAYTLLYWKQFSERERKTRLAIGSALFIAGFLLLKLFVSNSNYSHFLPTSLAEIVANLHNPVFTAKLGLFALVNLPLLALACFEWRLAVIAVVLMLPNALGNIGGAEKIGWITHYDSYYLPALFLAAMFGYEAAYKQLSVKKALPGFYAASAVLVLFLSMINPSSFAPVSISPSNISGNFFIKFPQQALVFLTPAGLKYRALGEQIDAMIPQNTVVSTSESLMPFLYRNRTIRYLPVDVDHADYAVVAVVKDGNAITYGGVSSFLGPDEKAKVNAAIIARMRKDGYDFAHAQAVPAFGLAIVKRIHRS